jgi:uroporphyrinogen-III synthase
LRAIRSDFFGFEPILLPSATLSALQFSRQSEEQIVAADALIFPSPFAVNTSFNRTVALRIAAQRSLPLFAVIGQGSYQALLEEISVSGRTKDQFHVVANSVEPFDAEHLAPILSQALNDLLSTSGNASQPSCKVVLLRGDRANNDAQVWLSWLEPKSSQRGLTVTEVPAYETRANGTYSEAMAKTMPDGWCNNKSVVYFSSSSSVHGFAKALRAFVNNTVDAPVALTIHPKISHEVQLHLGWKVVELSVGPQALLHWLSQNSKNL